MRACLLAAILVGCSSTPGAIDARPRIDAGLDAALDAAPPARATEDLPDDAPGAYQIHVLYVVPADRTPAAPLDTDGSIRRSVAAFDAWFAAQTGGPRLRFDTAGGVLDVTYVKLDPPYAERALAEGTVGAPAGPDYLRDRLEALLAPRFAEPHKMYLVYWDGLSFRHCGGAPLPPLLHGHMPSLQVGGLFASSFLTADAGAGATQLAVYSLANLPLGAAPFDATLGSEAVRVIAVGADTLTLAAPLAAAHPAGEPLQAATTIPDCRANAFSPDGHTLAYWEFSGAHEILHTLGIAPPEAADYAPPPVAPGHLAATGPDGTADLMYQGTANWGCLEFPPATAPATSACRLDSGHRNYFAVTGRTVSVDLAASVFLEPTPAGAVAPLGW
ncbi:MAG: hypothetical protein K8W52_35205 [Deltaproteobacteria bacterium]|nr:hypothetical protein [Deltaproteobacteria bacterium]